MPGLISDDFMISTLPALGRSISAPAHRAANDNARGIDWASLRFMYFLLAERRHRHGMSDVRCASSYYGLEPWTRENRKGCKEFVFDST